MKKLQIKQCPVPQAGNRAFGRSRDGTSRMPRDGTEGRSRDGTRRVPRDGIVIRIRDGMKDRSRDGTYRVPRDGIIRIRDGTEFCSRNQAQLRTRNPGPLLFLNGIFIIKLCPTWGKPRDRIGMRPRDGTDGFENFRNAGLYASRSVGKPMEGEFSFPGDKTDRKPRDSNLCLARGRTVKRARDLILPQRGSPKSRIFTMVTLLCRYPCIRGKTRFRWRRTIQSYRPAGPVGGEVQPFRT